MNLYQHAKNQVVSSIDLKILSSDWLRAFGPYLRNQTFLKYETRQKYSNTNLHFRTNSEEANNQNFQKIKKTLSLAHFPHFGGKKEKFS